MVSILGGYHEFIDECSVHRRDIKMHVEDIISTLGMFSSSEGVKMHVEDIMSTSGDVQYIWFSI